MRVLVTGSAGHLGEALMRMLPEHGHAVIGVDLKRSEHTQLVGDLTDAEFVARAVHGVDAVIHTATLHKPHIGTHSRQDFVATNVTGTLNLLEAATAVGCSAFVLTSTTSVFGDAMRSAPGEPAVWVTEALEPQSKNIYGVTKQAAEGLGRIFHRNAGLPVVVLRTSRFFQEADDSAELRERFEVANLQVNELLYRRADIFDMATAHVLALERAADIGFDRLIVTSTPPFEPGDAAQLGVALGPLLAERVPDCTAAYGARGWRLPDRLDRVYDNARAREVLGWAPRFTFAEVVARLQRGELHTSELAQTIGAKPYHDQMVTEDGPYPMSGF